MTALSNLLDFQLISYGWSLLLGSRVSI